MSDSKESAPILTGATWWSLRDRFAQTFPTSVNAGYLMTVLNTKEETARGILANLKKLGLLDENGMTTDLANQWRDDSEYPAACAEICAVAYPEELRESVPGPDPDSAAAARWFRQKYRLGQGAANNAARTYVLIASADLDLRGNTRTAGAKKANAASARGRKRDKQNPPRPLRDEATGEEQAAPRVSMPQPQIAVQVNISPEMTPEQIDQVLASMAKYFYGGTTLAR